MQVPAPNQSTEEPSGIKPLLFSEQEQGESENDQDTIRDSELFIRKAFEESPRKGCELLFRRFHTVLCSHAVRYVYSKELAEDIVSEVFCKFWKKKSYESVTSSYRYYLFRSVRNESLNYLRQRFLQNEGIEAAEAHASSPAHSPILATQYEEVAARVEQLVEELPPQCRRVFLLNRFEGMKYREVADELGVSIKTVETHMSKALVAMREGLRDHL
ncbi:DNA-directed RNA polymerase sigma-70 factor [Persicitalea jodogahamensis]|uniref:DNA-directed RNA polymerase sigma-70 factor n=2 Tax=Persicitalea jodogahamensis TaxID=402147 RepID=A0A8J3GCW2_9BACT|nr:RNA polymerase sigma-70 factor [Persicitalea jodogahamensis]GHB87042.1 DNA-directed RNA polymerase sigma-70 factor [Persicitalea jodogahamensis]